MKLSKQTLDFKLKSLNYYNINQMTTKEIPNIEKNIEIDKNSEEVNNINNINNINALENTTDNIENINNIEIPLEKPLEEKLSEEKPLDINSNNLIKEDNGPKLVSNKNIKVTVTPLDLKDRKSVV